MTQLNQKLPLCCITHFFPQLDDDVFIHVQNIYQIQAWNDENLISGYVYEDVKPIRRAYLNDKDQSYKWICPRWMYPQDKFPNYAAGPAYIIPIKHVKCLYQMALKSDSKFYMEDIFVTGMLREKCNIELKLVLQMYKKDIYS